MGRGRENFYDEHGLPLMMSHINEDGVPAVSEDDMIVYIIGCLRIRVGCEGTGGSASVGVVWEWENEKFAGKGFCELIRNFRKVADAEIQRRKDARIAWKSVETLCKNLPGQLFWDDEVRLEILEDGLAEWLKSQ